MKNLDVDPGVTSLAWIFLGWHVVLRAQEPADYQEREALCKSEYKESKYVQ